MNWEEHIDRLKKIYGEKDLSVPYTDWVNILKKIEASFIAKNDSNYHFANWADTIKNKSELATIGWGDLDKSLLLLPDSANYLLIIPMGKGPTAKNYVYDCGVKALISLVHFRKASFFVADKRYGWLAFFCLSEEDSLFSVSKSGSMATPFDRLERVAK
jgi:hypothetical protein